MTYVSPVIGIEHNTFNTGYSKYASQFKTSSQNVANFVQRTLHDEGYLGVRTIKMGEEQIIALPPPIPATTNQLTPVEVAKACNDNILRDDKMAQIGKRIGKVDNETT